MAIAEQLDRYLRKARSHGLVRATRLGTGRVAELAFLELRSARWRIGRAKLPSDRALLNATAGNWKSVDALVRHLCTKPFPAFPALAMDSRACAAQLREAFAKNNRATIEKADAICAHQFRFLGRQYSFEGMIDWHLEPDSGMDWPRDYYEKIDRWMWSTSRPGDSKLPWELNRHQYFVTLGKAYWVTGDEKYAREFSAQLLNWIATNPVGMGINWFSALEVGIRVISWCFAFLYFRKSAEFERTAAVPFVKSLYQQCAFLRSHLTTDWKVPNNHIIGESAALVFAGSLFGELSDATEWISSGVDILTREIQIQTAEDGVNLEQATAYHRFVLDFLILCVVLADNEAIPPVPVLRQITEKMLNYAMHISTPDGRACMIGDADDGRGFVLDDQVGFSDFRPWLAAGAVLFGRGDFKHVAGYFSEEAFWLLGAEGRGVFEALRSFEPLRSEGSFPAAGQHVMRSGWTLDSDVALFRCGPFGLGGDGLCAHAHCDLLGFTLDLRGKPVLVDSGTYSYCGSWRNYFRTTRAHNTVLIDGREQAFPESDFAWRMIPQAECAERTDDSVAGILASGDEVRLKRELRYLSSGHWRVLDTLTGTGDHAVEWFFHFAPDLRLKISIEGDRKAMALRNGVEVAALTFPSEGVHVEVRDAWFSDSYGVKVPSQSLWGRWNGRLKETAVAFEWQVVSRQVPATQPE